MVAGHGVALARREVETRQDHIRALRTRGAGCEAWLAHVESCCVIRLRELPHDVYLKTVSDARQLIDGLLTSAAGRLGWDRSYLLLSISDTDIGHTDWRPRCIVRSPPQIITHVHQCGRLHLDLVSIGTNGIPRTNLYGPRPSRVCRWHNQQATDHAPAVEIPVMTT
jgi:hypothetical protein